LMRCVCVCVCVYVCCHGVHEHGHVHARACGCGRTCVRAWCVRRVSAASWHSRAWHLCRL
jgi:hypothetical protein